MLTVFVLLCSLDDEFAQLFIDFMGFAAEIRQIVYGFIFRCNAGRQMRFKQSKLPFSGDYSHQISTILQTSKRVYREACSVLYREKVLDRKSTRLNSSH